MPIDKTELAAEIDKNPEIATAATEALTKKGFVIRDKASDTTFLDNYKKDVIEKEMPARVSEIYNRLDTDIETLSGVKKQSTEKTHEYLKRATEVKVNELNTKIEGYEKMIREKGDPTGVLQKKIEAAEERARMTIAEKDKAIQELTAKTELSSRKMLLNSAYAELSKTFIKNMPPMWDSTRDYNLEKIMEVTVMKDGVLYVGDGQGGIKKDASFNPVKIDDELKTRFKDVIDTKREQWGAGTKGAGAGEQADPTTINKDNFVMPADVKTQDDLMQVMLKSGIARGTSQFTEIWNKYALGYETVMEGTKKVQKTVGKALPAFA